MNKKADDRYLTIWNFFMWALVGGALVIVVLLFYALTLDIKGYQAKYLTKGSIATVDDHLYYDVKSSDTDLFTAQIGVMFEF